MMIILIAFFLCSNIAFSKIDIDENAVPIEFNLVLKSIDQLLHKYRDPDRNIEFKRLIKNLNLSYPYIPRTALIFGTKSLIFQTALKKSWSQFSKMSQISLEDIKKFQNKYQKISADLSVGSVYCLKLLGEDLERLKNDPLFRLIQSVKAPSRELKQMKNEIRLLAPWVHGVINLELIQIEKEMLAIYFGASHTIVKYAEIYRNSGYLPAQKSESAIFKWTLQKPAPQPKKSNDLGLPSKLAPKEVKNQLKKKAEKIVEKIDIKPTPTPLPNVDKKKQWTPSD